MRHPDRPLRVGLLGCGRVAASIHLPVVASLPGARLVALAEPDAARRDDAARMAPGAAAFGDFRDLLSRAELDAVVITLPNPLHAPAAVAAFDRGLHVYLEKPLALDAADGAQVIGAWRRSGTVGMVGYNYRFHPQYLDARRLVREGRIGPLVMLQGIFTTASRELPEWKRARMTGGGALLDLVAHHLDLAGWLCGEAPESVGWQLASRRTEDDTAVVQVRFPSGVVAQLAAGFGAAETHRFEIVGEQGTVTVEPYHTEALRVVGPTLAGVRLHRWRSATAALVSPRYWASKATGAQWHRSYRGALAAFVDGATTGRQPAPDLQAGQDTLVWLAEAASMRNLAGNTPPERRDEGPAD